MTCPNCKKQSAHIRVDIDGSIGCHHCLGFSESGGPSTDKILTRNSTRVSEQQEQFEGDMQPPYTIDNATNAVVVNEDFINLYPEQAAQTYTPEELKSVGQPDLKPKSDSDKGGDIEFKGDEKQAIGDIVKT